MKRKSKENESHQLLAHTHCICIFESQDNTVPQSNQDVITSLVE